LRKESLITGAAHIYDVKAMLNNNLCSFRDFVLRALCAAISVFALASSALAQDWRFEPILRGGVEFDDNATLDPRTDEEIVLTGLLVEGSVDLYFSSPRTSFFVEPRVLVRNYDDEAVLDSTDYFLRSTYRHEAESNTVGVNFNYDRQAVRNAERLETDLEIDDPDEIPNNDTGRTFSEGTRSQVRFFPYWEYRFSKLSSIHADLQYVDSQYEDISSTFLSDYSDARLNFEYRRELSNITSGGILLTGRRYDSTGLPAEVDTTGILLTMRHALSEKTTVTADVGLEQVDEANVDFDPEIVGRLRLTRSLEIIRLFAEYRREIYGDGAGVLSARDSINLNFQRRLHEKISAGLAVRAYQTNRIGGGVSSEQRNYVQLQSSLFWYLSRSFVVQADYRYTVIDRGEEFGGIANSNQVTVWLVYQPRTVPGI
jgi:hypothetical protein